MKTYKEVTETRKTQDKLFCDICKKESNGRCLGDWMTSSINTFDNEITIKRSKREVTYYYDMGSSDELEVDLCPACFSEVLEFIRSKGAKVDYVHSEW